MGDLGGSWDEEVEKVALAGSHPHPGEAKSVIRIAFLAVSAERRRASRQFLGMHISEPDAQGRGVRGEGKPSPRPTTREIYPTCPVSNTPWAKARRILAEG